MKVKHFTGISDQFFHGRLAIPLSTIGFLNDQAHLCPQVLRIEIYKVGDAYDICSTAVGDDQTELLVGEDIASGIGNIVVKDITGIRDIGTAHPPQIVIILDTIEQIQVFGLHRTQQYKGTTMGTR